MRYRSVTNPSVEADPPAGWNWIRLTSNIEPERLVAQGVVANGTLAQQRQLSTTQDHGHVAPRVPAVGGTQCLCRGVGGGVKGHGSGPLAF